MAKNKSPYPQTPAVPPKQMAGTNPVGVVIHIGATPSTVPKKTGFSPGLNTPSEFNPKRPHGFGHSVRQRQGHHRLSGVPDAHMVGKKIKPTAPKTNVKKV